MIGKLIIPVKPSGRKKNQYREKSSHQIQKSEPGDGLVGFCQALPNDRKTYNPRQALCEEKRADIGKNPPTKYKKANREMAL